MHGCQLWSIKYISALTTFYTGTQDPSPGLMPMLAVLSPAFSAYHAPFLTNCVTVSSICLSDKPAGKKTVSKALQGAEEMPATKASELG